ncbi:acetyl-CoA C-acyltransferase [uncultured Agrococcus sp.]|uniref:acetyl-CoA C-acyltransferase n=1 Tax=uncultured Agrococcus sp. TaxID=382258 RepID=UPI0025F5AAED|nr:acetyl-CoA C-acyltransferase [uncultured Agrococcus sp.]
MTETLIAGFARTPFAKFLGQLARVPATQLGGHAAKAALEKAGVDVNDVQQVVVGQVLQGGAGQNPARQSAVAAGIGMDVPSLAVNGVCLSGSEAVVAAHRLIQLGEADVVVAIGQESMTLAPHAASIRAGAKFGDAAMVDTMQHDGLTDAFERRAMGASTESFNASHDLTREEQDEFAASSFQRFEKAQAAGAFDDEIAPIEVGRGKRATTVGSDDGGRNGVTAESLGSLRPAFDPEGTITAGNASQITDGAAALVLVSDRFAAEHGLHPLARILSTSLVAGPDVSLHEQPSNAIKSALDRAGKTAEDLGAVEINEAFAAVGIVSTKALGIDAGIVNANGGAIAMGHPIGASGARIVGHLARRLAQLGAGSVGATGICGGGGQGTALVLEAV